MAQRLAADGTPWFPPLTDEQKKILARRSAVLTISFDPDMVDGILDVIPLLTAALPEGVRLTHLRSCEIGRGGVTDVNIDADGRPYVRAPYTPPQDD